MFQITGRIMSRRNGQFGFGGFQARLRVDSVGDKCCRGSRNQTMKWTNNPFFYK